MWTLWQIFHQSIQFVGNLLQNQNSEAQRNYDCDSCGKSSNYIIRKSKKLMLDKKITNVFHVENISLNQLVWWFIIHQGQNHKCDYCGKFYTQMTNLKMHLWFLCPRWIILIWIIRLMKNLYTHFQIACFSEFFATLITIKSFLSWTAIILYVPKIQYCVWNFCHTHHIYIF